MRLSMISLLLIGLYTQGMNIAPTTQVPSLLKLCTNYVDRHLPYYVECRRKYPALFETILSRRYTLIEEQNTKEQLSSALEFLKLGCAWQLWHDRPFSSQAYRAINIIGYCLQERMVCQNGCVGNKIVTQRMLIFQSFDQLTPAIKSEIECSRDDFESKRLLHSFLTQQ